MAHFQLSILPFIDAFDIDVLKTYKMLGVNQIHYDMIDNEFYIGKGYCGAWVNELHQLGYTINVHIMSRDLTLMLGYIENKPYDAVSFQIEPFTHDELVQNLAKIKKNSNRRGIAIEYTTDISQVDKTILDQIDFITLMSVKPGKGGQKFNAAALDNLKKIKTINQQRQQKITVHLDGGVDANVVEATKGLVDNYVSGSYFVKLEPKQKIAFLKQIALI